MKRHLNSPTASHHLRRLFLAACLALPLFAVAGPVELSTVPLANATTTTVLPNLMFILDNSGSMGQDYTPDYMSKYNVSVASNSNPWTDDDWYPGSTEKVCKDSADDNGSVSNAITASTNPLKLCVVGDVPYMTSAMNSQYYNPAIRYLPGVNADGTSKPSQSTPTSVLTDGYGKQSKTQLNSSTAAINLTTTYPDRVWCTTDNPTAADLTDPAICRKNSDYLYPDTTYKYGRSSSDNSRDVQGVYGAPYYYDVRPTEYCTAANLTTCTTASSATGAYIFPAKSRWCSDLALTTCQATKTSSYNYPRYVGGSSIAAVAATGYATVGGTSKNKCFSSISINGIEILGATTCWGNTEDDARFAALLKDQINTYKSSPEYTATINGSNNKQIDITSTLAAGATANGNIIYTSTGTSLSMQSGTDVKGGVTAIASLAPYTFVRTDIVPATTSYPKASTRTDCTGATCTYADEITNFGNWYAYYRTRMQSMKSAASQAFKTIDNKYRVGFITIANQSNTGNYLPIAKFDNVASGSEAANQKSTWYKTLFAISPSSSTPLRSALSTVGRIFAGKKPVGTSDPMQYSCQQNFALLTTDGYWNTDEAIDVKDVSGGTLGNLDGGSTAPPMFEGPTSSNGSLADVAKYYYDTDLRSTALGNCTGSSGLDVCENNVFVSSTDNNVNQHMTTFTLGLGVDGTVTYSSDYKTAADLSEPPTDARLDYYNILKGVGNWSVPTEGNETTVDDLWHAAVNGKGVYFSAKDPAQLASGLDEALAAIGAKIGAGAAAATSTLNPVTSDNYVYVASYTTVSWTGNLEARSINTITGKVNKAASWCVENTQAGTCVAPGAVVASSSGSSTVYNCVTSVASESACSSPGMYDSAVGTCNVTLPIACAGRMTAPGVVGASTDGRNIYTKSSSGTSLVPFEIANLNSTYFDAAKQAGLSQWSTMTSTQKSALTGANLVKFLRGQNGYEDRASNALDNRLYRYRGAVLGDAVESQPAHIAKPTFSYLDSGYDAFKTTNASRAGTVYMGANDGMLHAFNAATGDERWAYIPTMLHPNLWKLADKNYATLHTYYANGSPIISDIYSGGAWKTILVAGLNGGGRGYYALDITNPTTPTLLWEFDTTSQNNLGYSFARPVITKKSDGTWVVLITSGYNNTSPGNGCGYLYVLNAATGTQLSALPTGACSSSGLGKIAVWADDPEKNNTATYTYGGDLLGNLWRFDINSGAVVKLAELKDSSGNAQPITTSPELGQIETQRVVFVGTGKYLEITDLTNTQQQTIYAIKDSDPYPTSSPSATLVNPRSSSLMKKQTFSASGAYRKSTGETINWLTDRGWYINFLDSGERQNVDSQLILGTLLVPSIVPSNTVCAPGGTGWLNFVDYRTGQGREDSLNQYASLKTNAPIVGFNVITLPSGKKSVSIVTSDDPTPASVGDGIIGFDPLTSGFQKKRVIWREYIPQ